MAIDVGSLRSAATKAKMRKATTHPIDACELCQKSIKDPANAPKARIDFERYQFVTEEEALARGDAVSFFSVGPDCERKIRRALAESAHKSS